MDTFRWVLLAIGIIIFIVIYLISKRKAAQYQPDQQKIAPVYPSDKEQYLNDEMDESSLDSLASRMRVSTEDEVIPRAEAGPSFAEKTQQDKPLNAATRPDRLIALYLVEKHGGLLAGSDIIAALEATGMRYGDMKIFHYLAENANGDMEPVFSIANLVEPGWFDLISISSMRTPGLSIFLNLPGPIDNISAFDAMVVVISKLESMLPVTLKDKSRSEVTKAMLQRMREEIAV